MVPLAAGHAEVALQVERRDQLARDHQVRQVRSELRELGDQPVGEAVPCLVPTRLQIVRRVVHDRGEHVLAAGRQAVVVQGRQGDLERWALGIFAVLGVVEGALQIVRAGGHQDPALEILGAQAAETGQAIERQVELGRRAAHAQVLDPAHEAGVQLGRADQLEEGALGVGVGDHPVGRQGGAVGQRDAGSPVAVDQNARGGRVRAQHRAVGPGRIGECFGDRAHTAARQTERTGRAVAAPGQTVKQRDQTARRARPQIGAEHGVEAIGTLDQGTLDLVIEQVGDVHAGDPQELPHVPLAEQAQGEAEPPQGRQVVLVGGAEARRLALQIGPERAGEAQETPVQLGEARLVFVGHLGPAGAHHLAVAQHQMTAFLVQVDRLQALGTKGKAVLGELQILGHGRAQEVQDVGHARHPEAGRDLAGHRGAAKPAGGLEQGHLVAGARQVGGADQAVVAAADDDRRAGITLRRAHEPRTVGLACRSRSTSRAALAPGAAMTPPPGWAEEPQR